VRGIVVTEYPRASLRVRQDGPGQPTGMATDIAQRFIDALHELESDRSTDALAELYAEDAVSGNTATSRTYGGPDGAREFWSGYRDAFGDVRSQFRVVVASNAAVALEWTSTGTLPGGEDIGYEGVTVLELDGDRITRSTAYFDPRAILGHATVS
jgi:steroid delta-isomerase-like uncharacterized protein